MKIILSKKSLTGRKGHQAGYRYDDDGKVIGLYRNTNGKLAPIDTSKLHKEIEVDEPVGKGAKKTRKVKRLVVDEAVQKKLAPVLDTLPLVAPIDPGFVDEKTYGTPKATGRVVFRLIDENSPTVKKLRALGVTNEQMRQGFLLHDPKSFPTLEITVV